ncbi:MAG TPA: BamA/TamA family outer membrane protein [Gemmatimonadaceae bacterium]
MLPFLALPAVLVAQQPAPQPPIKPEVVALTLKGIKSVDPDELLLSIATGKSHCTSFILAPICSFSKSRLFYRKQYLDHDELRRDVLRIRVFYWKRGFRETQVDTVVADRGTKRVAVTFDIKEGPPTTLSDSISVVQQNTVLSPREVSDRTLLKKGQPLNLLRLDSTVVFLQQRVWDKGYADAVIDTSVVLDSIARSAAITITIDPKWKATISDILIEGEDRLSERTIRKSLTFHSGQLFRRSDLLRSQRGLYESNLFRRASIEVPTQGDSTKIVVVTIQEAPPRDARLAFGFNTVDFFQLEGRFTHYNFTGGARRLEVQAAVGNLFAGTFNGKGLFHDVRTSLGADKARYFAPTYNASVNLRQPWFISSLNELAIGAFGHRRSAPGIYVDRGYGASATFTRTLLERASASLNYRFEITRIEAGDVYFCVNYSVCDESTLNALRGQQRLSPLIINSNIDRSNDPLEPNKGVRGNVEFEHASEFTLSDFRYNRAFGDGAAYYSLANNRVLAGHLRLGWVKASRTTKQAVGSLAGIDILHPRKRFYAGGSRSVRGFRENQLGPRILTIAETTLRKDTVGCPASKAITSCDPNSKRFSDIDFDPRPLGGNIVVDASAEIRVPVMLPTLFAAAFVDGGWVSQRINPTLPRSKAAITPGFGARYLSPVGPIRIDIGINPGRAEELPVVSEQIVNGERQLVTLEQRRRFQPARSGFRGVLDRMILHLSIGEAF